MSRSSFMLPFTRQEKVANETYSFYFKRTEPFNFLPGQYITLHFGEKDDDYDNLTHDFTIASSPLETNYIMITTKTISHSKFKGQLLSLNKGQKVRFSEPTGGFYFQETVQNYVFLAGGIGITPFHSILTYISEKNLSTNATLFVSFSTSEDIVFYDKLNKIAEEHTNIQVIYTITRPEESESDWKSETGRITEKLIKKYVPNITLPRYLIVGADTMVAAVEEVINNMGVKDEQIQIENFTGY